MSDLAGLPGAGTGHGKTLQQQAIGVCPECGAAMSVIYGPIREFARGPGQQEWARPWSCCHCKARGIEYLIVELDHHAVSAHQDLFERCDE